MGSEGTKGVPGAAQTARFAKSALLAKSRCRKSYPIRLLCLFQALLLMGIPSPPMVPTGATRFLEDFAAQKTKALDKPLSAEPLYQPPSSPESEVPCLP